MQKYNSVVTIYKSHAEAEAAVKELQKSGFDSSYEYLQSHSI